MKSSAWSVEKLQAPLESEAKKKNTDSRIIFAKRILDSDHQFTYLDEERIAKPQSTFQILTEGIIQETTTGNISDD